ncbi:hypothetical protein MKW92_032610 [Papaver armeniacum]|nr:hypothetical protein MKW92_032610 [Papaver armeniacum]
MMNTGFVDNAFRPLDLGNFPPWHITVTVAGGETRHINIPYPEGNRVIGLPLGFDVPEVIAGRYEELLQMVQGMRDLITGIVRDLARCQLDAARFRQDAARFCKDANHYYYELEELKLTMGGNMGVSQVLMPPVSSPKKRKLRKVSSSRKRKLGTEESGLSETQAVCIKKPEHLRPPKSNDRPSTPGLLVQESVIEDNMDESDVLPQREDVPSSAALVCSDVQTEKVESVAGVVPIRQSVDASALCTSANCLTVDSTTLTISNSIDITPPLVASTNVSGQGEDEGFEYADNLKSDDLPLTENVSTDVQTEQVASVAGVMLVEEPVDATMIFTSANCLTADCTTLTISTPIDITTPVVESTSVSGQGEDEGFEYADNLKSDDLPLTENVSTDVQTEQVASVAGVMLVEEPVDATMIFTSANYLTADCTTLTISTPIDITPPIVESTSVSGQGEDEGFEDVENLKLDDLPLSSMKRSKSEDFPTSASLICSEVKTEMVESVAGSALVVWEPVDATMTSTSANCQTGNCTALTISTPTDISLPLIVSTSVPSRVGDEWFEYVDNFRIPKVYADLYNKIFSKYGHMATKKVIRSNDDILLASVISLMKIVSRMETIRGVDLSVKLIESWEGDIGDAETLQFNIKWLREIFNALKNSWKSSFKIDKEVETLEQVLDATQVEYSELLKVKMDIRKLEAQISSEREAIQVKIAEKNIFLFKPVLGNLFNLEITN